MVSKGLRVRLPIAGAAAVFGLLAWSHNAHAGTLHHAALVVEHSSGRVITRCVGFLEDQISGLQLIERSGIEYQTQQFGGLGSAICQLDYEPQAIPSGCFGGGAYWQYFHRTPSGWVQSGSGASTWSLHDGDMDGWRYASGAGQAPLNMTFNSVCVPSAPSVAVAATSHAPLAGSTAPRTTAAPQLARASGPSPSPTATASLEAIAPMVSPTARTALAETGPDTSTGTRQLVGPVALIAVATASLLALGYVNFRRRAP